MLPKAPILKQPFNLIILFAILQLCVAFFTDAQTFTHEESMWHYIGRNWFRHGLTPYAGGVDNKSPLIFAVFGVSDILFGINYWFPRILGVIVQSAGLFFIYKIAFSLNARSAIITTTLYGLSLLWHATGGKYVSFTETYAITFLLAAVYYKDKSFIGGLLAGMAICWRLSAVFGVSALIIAKRKDFIPFIAGIITSTSTMLLLAAAAGINLHDIYLYAIAENFGGGSTTDHPFSWKIEKFTQSFFYSELILFYTPLIACFFTKKQNSFLTTWLLFEFIGINILGIYAYPHFKQLLPPLCLISGIAIANLIEQYKVPFKQVMIIIWIVFFPKITEPITGLKKILTGYPNNSDAASKPPYPHPDELAEKQLGLWLKKYTNPQEKVLVLGYGARVQLYSERLSPTIYFNLTQTLAAKEQLLRDLNQHRPEVVARPIFPDYTVYITDHLYRDEIDFVLATKYTYETTISGYRIYRRFD